MTLTASAQQQWRLLDVQAHDTKLAQLAHRARTLPERATVSEVQERRRSLSDDLVAARTVAGDITREMAKAEADVEQVRVRATRDRARLESGQGSAKDVQALANEVESLARRQAVLEDVELEIMERLEVAEAEVARLAAQHAALDDDLAAAEADLALRLGEIDDETTREGHSRADAAAGVPADLLDLYEKIRAVSGGVGAAKLYQRRCEGCRLELNNVEINALRAAADDAVARCEECSRILIRTPESGL